ncbi:MAG TPA: glycosyltransferase [Bacteroidales bacterium]|nr:glycosyltransferase [Bacteroidales bacterium]
MGERFLLIVFLVFTITAAIQIFYYLYFYLAISTKKPIEKKVNHEPVSIIICARNEEENLRNFLPSILEQDYPAYEVIVVNDCSEDGTYLVLGEYLKKYQNLRVSTITKDPKFTHYKKFAQFIGIKAAKHELLLFTDADCTPVSKEWIEGIVSNFDDKTNYVLGYGGYLKAPGLLNAYIRNETFVIAIQYLGMAIRGIPYMAVGRNLAYRKSEFFNNGGYGLYSHLASGDDDLFINNNAKPENTVCEYRHPTQTRSVACKTTEEWIKQKQRHLTTASYYKPSHKFLLIMEPLTRMLFYTSFIVLVSLQYLWIEALSVLGFRLITQIIVFALAQKKLKEPGLMPYSIFFDIFSPIINGILFISRGRNKGINQWS